MNHREIRDALASVFLEVELTVRVKHARSTDSVYLYISNGHGSLAYVIRIANHPSSRKFSKIDDYWIDGSKLNVIPDINTAIQGAARRLGVHISEVVPEVVQEASVVVSEEVVQVSDYSNQSYRDHPPGMINLEQYYLSAHGFVCAIDNNPERVPDHWNGYIPESLDESDPWGGVKFFVALVLIMLAVYYLV